MRQTLANIRPPASPPSSTSAPEAESSSFTTDRDKESTSFITDRDTHSSTFANEHLSESTSSATEHAGNVSLSEREAERDTQGSTRHEIHRKVAGGKQWRQREMKVCMGGGGRGGYAWLRKAEDGMQGSRRHAMDRYNNLLPLQSSKKSRVGSSPRSCYIRRRRELG